MDFYWAVIKILNMTGTLNKYLQYVDHGFDDQGWDSPTLKLYYHSVWLALFYWKTILVEKTVIVELYESLPWIMTSFVKCSHHDLNNGCFQILATTSGSEYQTSQFSQILFPFDLHWYVFEIYSIKLLPSLGRFHKVGCMVQSVAIVSTILGILCFK